MYNFEPYNVLLSIATNIPVLLMNGFVLQGHIYTLFSEEVLKLIVYCSLMTTNLSNVALFMEYV